MSFIIKDSYQVEYCKHCGRKKGQHRAKGLNCPLKKKGKLGNFPQYGREVFELGKIKTVKIK